MDHSGGCHCGNIHVLLRLSKCVGSREHLEDTAGLDRT